MMDRQVAEIDWKYFGLSLIASTVGLGLLVVEPAGFASMTARFPFLSKSPKVASTQRPHATLPASPFPTPTTPEVEKRPGVQEPVPEAVQPPLDDVRPPVSTPPAAAKPKADEVPRSKEDLLGVLKVDPNSLQGRLLGEVMDFAFTGDASTREKSLTVPKTPVPPPITEQQGDSCEGSGACSEQQMTPREQGIYDRLSKRAIEVRQLEQ